MDVWNLKFEIWVVVAYKRALRRVFDWETKLLFTGTKWSLKRSGCHERVDTVLNLYYVTSVYLKCISWYGGIKTEQGKQSLGLMSVIHNFMV